jgi:hypothetical protein
VLIAITVNQRTDAVGFFDKNTLDDGHHWCYSGPTRKHDEMSFGGRIEFRGELTHGIHDLYGRTLFDIVRSQFDIRPLSTRFTVTAGKSSINGEVHREYARLTSFPF